MKPYGVKRSWNNDILVKNGVAQRRKTHTKWKKLMHRRERRTWNNNRSTICTNNNGE